MTRQDLEIWVAEKGGPIKAAALLGVSYQTLWRWLNEKTDMNPMLDAKIKEIG